MSETATHRLTKYYYAAVSVYCQEEDRQNVIGYVDTDYTKRSLAEVESDVNAYNSFYPSIDGIFLDRMEQLPTATAESAGCTMTREAYYQTIYSYIHTKDSEADVIGNPGAAAATAWQLNAPAADEVVTFEGTSSKYAAYSPHRGCSTSMRTRSPTWCTRRQVRLWRQIA